MPTEGPLGTFLHCRETCSTGKLEGVVFKDGDRVTPTIRNECHSIRRSTEEELFRVNSPGQAERGVVQHSPLTETGGADESIANESKTGEMKPAVSEVDGWIRELVRVSSMHLPPSHPCLKYIREQGFDLGKRSDFDKFTAENSPLGGKRW